MKKYYLFAALAATVLASCTNDDFMGDVGVTDPSVPQLAPIMFTSNQQAFTRADFTGAEAAGKLGNQFVVFGYKGSLTASPATNKTVFDNYLVEYAENTAHTTESNTNNWEYVGKNPIHWATEHGITQQTIKYWDYSQNQYDFFAWSTGSKTAIYDGTPAAGQVLVSEMAATPATTGDSPAETGLKNAYTFTGTADDLAECYISDLVTVKKTGKGTGDTYGVAENGYNNAVTLAFRQLGTKVRFGIYETVPGYSVKDVKFYTKAVSDANTDNGADNAVLFTTVEGAIRTSGKYTVYFPTVDTPTNADNNQAHIIFDGTNGTSQKTLENGTLTNNYTIAESGEKGDKYLGRTSNTATFAGAVADNYYKIFLPNEDGANLNLRVNYTLESIDGSGEIIEVKGATAQVPSIYAKWLPGYAYTYLFKISDKTNGYTGVYDPTNPNGNTTDSNPAGLYPITFDAVVVNAEDGKTQETITTVSAPSITTYQKGSTVVNSNEYVAATGNIYVTVNDAPSASPDLPNGVLQDLTDKAALYKIPAGKTEADVIDALQMQDDDNTSGTIKGRNGLVLTDITSSLTLTNTVEFGVDGNAITIPEDGTKKKATYFTPTANTTDNPGKTYAFVYTKTAPDASGVTAPVDKYQQVAFSNTDVTTKYRYDLKAATAGDVEEDVFYFDDSTTPYTSHTVFLGQTVSNLYTRTGSGIPADPYVYSPASGYAKSGTDYYYTIDGGRNYTKAENIAFASFGPATDIYTRTGAGTTSDPYVWSQKATTVTEPVSGTAYYQKKTIGTEDVYSYCVVLPEQTTGLKVLDTTKYIKATEGSAVTGMTYFDKYTQNYGVYYAKVIKVQ